MNGHSGVRISAATALAIPAALALPAIETILKEFAHRPGETSLALNIQQVHVPLEAMISVPIEVRVAAGHGRCEWLLSIRAASKPQFYPTFEGELSLLDAQKSGSQLQIDGSYAVPFGALGRVIDLTILRGVAESSLRRFIRDIANRVAALSRWANFA